MCVLVVLLALTSAAVSSAADVTATRLDGSKVVGRLESWDGTTIVVRRSDGPVTLTASRLLALRWSPAPPAGESERAREPLVELVDGSMLPIDDFGQSGQSAELTLRSPLPPDGRTMAVPLASIAAVCLQPLSSEAARQWAEIRRQSFPSDVLVVVKRGGESLDYVEGKLGDVSADHVQFALDDEPSDVNRSKVAGFVYYRREGPEDSEPQCVIHTRAGSQLVAAAATVKAGVLHIATPSGAEFDWPLSDVHFVDYSAGKVVFLSDLEPASEEWTPLVALPAGAALANNYGRVRRDASAFGGPLSLQSSEVESYAPSRQMQYYDKGLAIRSRTEIVYRLPKKGFRQLLAVAGIDPATSDEGSVKLSILGDDRPLLETEVIGSDEPRVIELDIADVKRLKIIADYGKNLDTGDWINLCDLRIVK